MIYILTGIAKSGKSLVVKTIQKRYDIPVISTDAIMMDIHKKEQLPDFDIYASDRTVGYKLEPFIFESIRKNIQSNTPCLYEGVHFNGDFAHRLLKEFPNELRILYLGYKDITVKDKVEELFKYKDQIDNPWIFDHQGEQVEDIVAYMIEESNRVYQDCLTYQLDYIDVFDINQQQEDIIRFLMT